MRSPSHVRIAIPVLCLVVGLGGCRAPQAASQRTAGLVVDVLRVKNARRAVDVGVKIFNDHDLNISFELGDVRLLCGNGAELSPANPRGQVQRLEVQSKAARDFRWTFPVEAALPAGQYTIQIKSFRELDVESPNKVEFTINV